MNRETEPLSTELEEQRQNKRLQNSFAETRPLTPLSFQEIELQRDQYSGVFLSIPKEAVTEFSWDVIQDSFEVLHDWMATFSGIREYVKSADNGSFILFIPLACAKELLTVYGKRFPKMIILKKER